MRTFDLATGRALINVSCETAVTAATLRWCMYVTLLTFLLLYTFVTLTTFTVVFVTFTRCT